MARKLTVGGQAVMEGVMMRGQSSWAVAVRMPDLDIAVESHDISGPRKKWFRWPFVRGVYVLGEQLKIGIKALMISANYQLEAEEEAKRPTDKQLGWTLGVALVFFAAVFILAPAALSKYGGRWLGIEDPLLQNIVEGGVRIGFFVGYILAISLVPDIRRVFQYHGAEHKTIYAFENSEPLEPEIIDKYTTLHVRCGTNFLFIVLFLTIIVHFFMDLALAGYAAPVKIAARLFAIPILAGTAYEVIKAASKDENSLVFRIASLPGLALQKITTRPPTYDQIEVAIKAMQAVISKEQAPEGDQEPGTAPATPG